MCKWSCEVSTVSALAPKVLKPPSNFETISVDRISVLSARCSEHSGTDSLKDV